MRLVLTVIGLGFIALAVVYFSMPADQLPAFVPGHQAGVMRVHTTHGAVAAAIGIVLLAIGWMMGSRRAA